MAVRRLFGIVGVILRVGTCYLTWLIAKR